METEPEEEQEQTCQTAAYDDNHTDRDNQTDQVLPEDEEIDMTMIPHRNDMITPPPSNHGTPISTTHGTPITNHPIPDRTMKFSQLKHLSIGEGNHHSNHVLSSPKTATPKIYSVSLHKGSSAPVTPSPFKSPPKRPKPISFAAQVSNSSTGYTNNHSNKSNSSQQPLQPPAISMVMFEENKSVCISLFIFVFGLYVTDRSGLSWDGRIFLHVAFTLYICRLMTNWSLFLRVIFYKKRTLSF